MGAAVGAALCGMRPVAEMQFSDFTARAMDQLVNQAAKVHFNARRGSQRPLVLRLPFGSGGRRRQHSQSQEAWYAHPGLKVVMPSNPADAKGLLHAAIDPNPVVFMEHKVLYRTASGPGAHGQRGHSPGRGRRAPRGPRPDHRGHRDHGVAGPPGRRGAGRRRHRGDRGRPRTLTPLDDATILERVRATGRALLIQEAPRTAGFMAEIAARITESDALFLLAIGGSAGWTPPSPTTPIWRRPPCRRCPTSSTPGGSWSRSPDARDRVPMPKLSMTMEEGELIAWVKQEGDQVRAGDVICEVNSDKVEMEVESPADGTLVRHTAAEGDVVPVGAPIAMLATEAEDLRRVLGPPPATARRRSASRGGPGGPPAGRETVPGRRSRPPGAGRPSSGSTWLPSPARAGRRRFKVADVERPRGPMAPRRRWRRRPPTPTWRRCRCRACAGWWPAGWSSRCGRPPTST